MSKGQPVSKESYGSAKNPKAIEEPKGYFKKNPSWRFSKADLEHEEWTIHDLTDDVIEDETDPTGAKIIYTFSKSIDRQLWDSLRQRERMTWAEIFAEAGGRTKGTNNHPIPMHELHEDAQKRAAELNIIEDGLFSLRLDGTHRVFGILDENGVLNIIWLDRKHKICPTSPK